VRKTLETRNWRRGRRVREVHELDVYRLAEDLSEMVWRAFDSWPPKAQRTLGYQIIRSSDSIAANLAEGYGRYTPADRRKFYLYARGSFEETKAWLRKAIRRGLVPSAEVEAYKALIDALGPKLNAFIRKTGKAPKQREPSVKLPVSSR
jgi:four helix bundle protein